MQIGPYLKQQHDNHMKRLHSRLMIAAAMLCAATSCSADDIPEGDELLQGITIANFPIIDGSDSTDPFRSILMCKILGFEYEWVRRPFTQEPDADIKTIQPEYTCSENQQHHLRSVCLRHSNTHGSFVNLIDGTVELVIAARSISRDEKVYADDKNVTLIEKPIARDALTFMVNPENPVDNITVSQIQGIYTGEITNWSEVGGLDQKINPYVRNPNSGSQEKFETLVMDGLTIKEFPELKVGMTMMSPYYQLEDDKQGIAFTPYYYYAVIVDNGSTKAIGLNGVAMTKENVRNGSYPYCTEVFAAVRSDIDRNSTAYKLFEYLTTPAGQTIVDESGYVPLEAHSGIAMNDIGMDPVVATFFTNMMGAVSDKPFSGINIKTSRHKSGRTSSIKVLAQ